MNQKHDHKYYVVDQSMISELMKMQYGTNENCGCVSFVNVYGGRDYYLIAEKPKKKIFNKEIF